MLWYKKKFFFEEQTYSSVLMNCPYFDEILEFEGKKKSLYEQIKKEGMPYHTVVSINLFEFEVV